MRFAFLMVGRFPVVTDTEYPGTCIPFPATELGEMTARMLCQELNNGTETAEGYSYQTIESLQHESDTIPNSI